MYYLLLSEMIRFIYHFIVVTPLKETVKHPTAINYPKKGFIASNSGRWTVAKRYINVSWHGATQGLL